MVRFDSKAPDIEGLRKFAESKDRSIAPFFVGRKDGIAAVERGLLRAQEAIQQGITLGDETLLFQGAPGAGKTSLLNHLKERFVPESGWFGSLLHKAGGGDEAGLKPLVATVDFESIHSESELVQELAAALDERIEKEFRTTAEKRGAVRAGGGADVVGFGFAGHFGFDFGRGASTAPPAAELANLARAMSGRGHSRPILLLADEVQNVRPGIHGDLLGLLHKGNHGLPVVLVCCGLGNSWEVLRNCGLTRLSDGCIHNIGALSVTEAREVVGLFFERFRVEGEPSKKADWAAVLEEVSDRWPEHLHTALKGLAAELADNAGRLFGRGTPQAAAALEAGRFKCAGTYGSRQSMTMSMSRRLLARLMAEIPVEPDYGITGGRIVDLLRRFDGEVDANETEQCLPEDMNAKAFMTHLIRQGALQARSHRDNRFHCPIPSFREWLVSEGGIDPVPLAPLYAPISGERISRWP